MIVFLFVYFHFKLLCTCTYCSKIGKLVQYNVQNISCSFVANKHLAKLVPLPTYLGKKECLESGHTSSEELKTFLDIVDRYLQCSAGGEDEQIKMRGLRLLVYRRSIGHRVGRWATVPLS